MKTETTKLKTISAALGLLLLGVVLVWIGTTSDWKLSSLIMQVGNFVIASVVLAMIFEFWQMRGLIEDMYSQAGITHEIREAGIVGFTTRFYDKNDWNELFAQTKKLDMYVGYAATWRNSHQHELEDLLNRPDSRIRVVLPDRHNAQLVAEMARRFEMNSATLEGRIGEAEEFYLQLANGKKGTSEVYRFPNPLVYTAYIFDDQAVFVTYKHQKGKGGPLITMTVGKNGDFYKWLDGEFQAMLSMSARAK